MTRTPLSRSTLVAVAIGFALGAGVTVAAVQQPHMDAALESLRAARHHLDEAEADKGGHRAKAIVLTDSAIAEVKAGIDYAKANH